MALSVNTNASALSALQNLAVTNASLGKVQTAINTGLKVASSKDNAAVFSIAQKLRSDVSGLNAVKSSLDRATSALDVAIAAGEAVSDLLISLKEKAVAAKDAGLDSSSRSSLNDDFKQLRDQITTIVENATFNGTNIVDGTTPKLVAITNSDASKTISIGGQNLSLGGSIVTLGATDVINTAGTASAAVDSINTSIANVNTALSALGSGANRVELQKTFVGKLSDSIQVGIGNLVDADMAKESANLQALQVKQQLGLQALSIANQAPQAITRLFQ